MKRSFVCIVCPTGCLLTVEKTDDSLIVAGNECPGGKDFAQQEIYNPTRVLTTTVKLSTGELLPVRSDSMVKKHEMKALVKELSSVVVTPPVTIGQTIMESFGENGVNIISASTIISPALES